MSNEINGWIEKLRSDDKASRSEAVRALSYMGAEAVDPLLEILSDEAVEVKVVANVLGQIGQPALDRLNDLVQEPEPDTRARAARMMAAIGDARSVLALVMMMDDDNTSVREAVAEALGSFSDPRAVGPLIDALGDDSVEVRANAATSLGSYYRDPRVIPALLEAASDPDEHVRTGSARAMAQVHDERIVTKLNAMTEDINSDVRLFAAAAIQYQQGDKMVFERMKRDISEKVDTLTRKILDDSSSEEENLEALRNSNPRVRARLLEEIGNHASAGAVKLLLPGLSDINPAVRQTAVDSLVRLGTGVVDPLIQALDSKSKYIRAGIFEALGIIGDERVIEPASHAVNDESEMVRLEAVRAVAKFGKRDDVIRILKDALHDKDKDVNEFVSQTLSELGVSTSSGFGRFFRRLKGD